MPQNITDTSAFTSPIVAPADGDAAAAASVLTSLQGLANRTAFLNNIIGPGAGTGTTRIRFGTSAVMTALTGNTTGDIFIVDNNAATPTVQGMYIFNASSALTVDSAFVYAASGGGQWVHELASFLNVNKGLAAVGPVIGGSASANRLLASVVPSRIFATPVTFGPSGNFTTTATSATLVTGSTTTIANVLSGDIVIADYVANVQNDAGGFFTSTWVGFSENLAGYVAENTSFCGGEPGGTTITTNVGHAVHTVTTGGTLGIGIMAASSSGAHTATVYWGTGQLQCLGRVWIVRP